MKKAQISTFVKISAIIIGGIVFFAVLWPILGGKLIGAGKQSECNWNLFLAAAVKAGSLGFAEIPVGCNANYLTVDSSMLDQYGRLAKKRTSKYCGLGQQAGLAVFTGRATQTELFYKEAAEEFCEEGKPTMADINEWSLDAILAKELVQCNSKVWSGELNVVTNNFWSDRVFCIVCSVISFSDDIPVSIRPSAQPQIDSLYIWMNTEPYYKKTYYGNIYEETPFIPLKEDQLHYSTSDAIAVVYQEQLTSTLKIVWKPALAALAVGGALVLSVGTGGLATAAAGAAAYAVVRAGQEESDAPVKLIGLQSYDTLQKEPPKGIGCTDIIA